MLVLHMETDSPAPANLHSQVGRSMTLYTSTTPSFIIQNYYYYYYYYYDYYLFKCHERLNTVIRQWRIFLIWCWEEREIVHSVLVRQ
ncbi:hypothetical protein FKM82_021050 [Ascaphus truei]